MVVSNSTGNKCTVIMPSVGTDGAQLNKFSTCNYYICTVYIFPVRDELLTTFPFVYGLQRATTVNGLHPGNSTTQTTRNPKSQESCRQVERPSPGKAGILPAMMSSRYGATKINIVLLVRVSRICFDEIFGNRELIKDVLTQSKNIGQQISVRNKEPNLRH